MSDVLKLTFVRVLIVLVLITFGVTSGVLANTGLDGIGVVEETPTQDVTQQDNQVQSNINVQSSGSAVGGLFQNVGIDDEASSKAVEITAPFARTVNLGMSIVLAGVAFVMMFITVLDLAYIAVPPLRKFLNPEVGQQQSGGIGGFGGGFGGMGGGSQPQQSSLISRWISDEALSAVAQLQPQQSGGGMGGFGGGFGGFGGGFGGMGGGFGGIGQQETPSTKSVIFSYLKARVVFLVMFGLCAVLLTTTLFTDIGVLFGSWVIDKLIGLFF